MRFLVNYEIPLTLFLKNNIMEQNKIDEILDHINTKFDENVPRIVKMLVRKKMSALQSFKTNSLPTSLRTCTVEELIFIVRHGLDTGKLKI